MNAIESIAPVRGTSYNNFEIHACHVGGYQDNKAVLLKRLSQIESLLCKKYECQNLVQCRDFRFVQEAMR